MSGELRVKQFEFDGQKMEASQAVVVHAQLKDELKKTEQLLVDNDEKIIAWFLHKTENKAELRRKYREFFQTTREVDEDVKLYGEMQQCLMPLYQEMQFAEIKKAIVNLKSCETEFRKRLEQLLEAVCNKEYISDEQEKIAKEYLSCNWKYFVDQVYVQDELNRLTNCLSLFYDVTAERAIKAKADVLTFQLAEVA
jgi:hypothetical protein